MRTSAFFYSFLALLGVSFAAYFCYGTSVQIRAERPVAVFLPLLILSIFFIIATCLFLRLAYLFIFRFVDSIHIEANKRVLMLSAGHKAIVVEGGLRVVKKFGGSFDFGSNENIQYVSFLANGRVWVCKSSTFVSE